MSADARPARDALLIPRGPCICDTAAKGVLRDCLHIGKEVRYEKERRKR